jgi:hypothetical protein
MQRALGKHTRVRARVPAARQVSGAAIKTLAPRPRRPRVPAAASSSSPLSSGDHMVGQGQGSAALAYCGVIAWRSMHAPPSRLQAHLEQLLPLSQRQLRHRLEAAPVATAFLVWLAEEERRATGARKQVNGRARSPPPNDPPSAAGPPPPVHDAGAGTAGRRPGSYAVSHRCVVGAPAQQQPWRCSQARAQHCPAQPTTQPARHVVCSCPAARRDTSIPGLAW